MAEIAKYIEGLLKRMDMEYWQIRSLTEIEEVEKDGKTYALEVGGNGDLYEKQEDEYVRQFTGYAEDDYYGFLLIPCDGKYLKVSYQC